MKGITVDAKDARQDQAIVLILEDEEAQRKTLTAIIEDEGLPVRACSRAAEAMSALAQGNVAVAVVDLRVPDVSTHGLLEALAPWSDRVPIIVHTAFASYESAKDALNGGAFAYVEKAGNPEELVRHVHRAFHSRLRRYAEELERAVDARTRELQNANAALHQSEKRYKALASELTVTEERLRRDVAWQIHDEISQTLAMAKAQIEALRETVSDQPLGAALAGIVDSLEQTLGEARALTNRLSYPALDVLGLSKAVEKWLKDEVEAKHGLATDFEDDLEDKPLDDDVRAALFRSVRELLTNVVKHAHATLVTVSITRAGDRIVVVVEDNGVGFDPEEVMARSQGFGILSVRQALERLDGSLDIESHPRAGSRIILLGPLKIRGSLERRPDEDFDRR
jgi:signal transduction histidine kinase